MTSEDNNVLDFIKKKRIDNCGNGYIDHSGPFTYNNSLTNLTCDKCGKEVNPIWMIDTYRKRFAQFVSMQKELQKDINALEKRKRAKCDHCGKFTGVKL